MTGFRVWRRVGVWLAAASLPALSWSFGAAAQSNGAAPQTTPPITFSLPPSGRPTPTPTPGPIVGPFNRPIPTQTPISVLSTPTPTPRPTATSTPVPSAVTIAPARRPATGAAQPAPSIVAPTASPTPAPEAVPTAPAPIASPTSDSVAPTPATAEPSSGWSTTSLAAIGVALLALVAFGGFLFGRRRARTADPVEELAPEPVAATPDRVAPQGEEIAPPVRRRVADEPQPKLEITLIPKRAGMNLMGAAVDYRVIVRNTGPVAARDINFAMYMLSASARQAQDLQMIFAAPIEKSVVPSFELEPGGEIDLSGMAMLAQEQINVMTIEGKPWFVPVLAMKADYRWGENVGAPGVATAAHMIGIDRGEGAKMAPFRLDAGPHMHPEVAERKVA